VWICEYRYEPAIIGAGGREICTALAKLLVETKGGDSAFLEKESKLDTCGSVSLAHRKFMTDIAPCSKANLPAVRLHGIGGSTNMLDEVGTLNTVLKDGKIRKVHAYVYDAPIGNTKEILLLSLRSTWDSKIDLMYHVEESLKGNVSPLRFRDGILDDYKKNMPEDRKQFNKMARKIHNSNKSAMDITSESEAYKEYSSERVNEPNIVLVGMLAGHKLVIADSKKTENQWRIDDGNGCMNLPTENYASALIAPGVTQQSSYEEHLSLMTNDGDTVKTNC